MLLILVCYWVCYNPNYCPFILIWFNNIIGQLTWLFVINKIKIDISNKPFFKMIDDNKIDIYKN